jgi:hypothetical protein
MSSLASRNVLENTDMPGTIADQFAPHRDQLHRLPGKIRPMAGHY